jgi:glycosyltransferase involved in cell wall biosynthesis
MNNKLIYILNHYSSKSTQHFYHVINLLEEISKHNVEIALIIEKCEDKLILENPNISVYPIRVKYQFLRPFLLFKHLYCLNRKGYQKVFIRITTYAAICSIIFSWFFRLKTYYWHSATLYHFNKQQPFLIRLKKNWRFNFVKRFITYFVTGPESMKNYYVDVYKINPQKILILYNDISLKRFHPAILEDKIKIKQELKIAESTKILLFVHGFSPPRNVVYYLPQTLIDFYSSNVADTYQTIIIGDGSELPKFKQIVSEKSLLQNKVKIFGSKPNSEIQKYFSIADIFIIPTMIEGFPRVLIEAMAMGLPVVTTDAGGIQDILPPKQKAFMTDKNDVDAFSQKLILLAKNEKLQKEIAAENLKHVRKFSTENVAKMYCNVIFGNNEQD